VQATQVTQAGRPSWYLSVTYMIYRLLSKITLRRGIIRASPGNFDHSHSPTTQPTKADVLYDFRELWQSRGSVKSLKSLITLRCHGSVRAKRFRGSTYCRTLASRFFRRLQTQLCAKSVLNPAYKCLLFEGVRGRRSRGRASQFSLDQLSGWQPPCI